MNATTTLRWLLTVTVTLLICACSSSHKQTASTGNELTRSELRVKARELTEAYAPWQNLSVPVTLSIRDSGLPRLSGTMTMTEGTQIHVSLRLLGMEMAALCVTGDSVKGYVKVQKTYLAESIPQLLGGYPATVADLQSLLLRRVFTIGADKPLLKDAVITEAASGNAYTIAPVPPAGTPPYQFEVSLPDNTLQLLTLEHGSKKGVAAYGKDGSLTLSGTMEQKSFGASVGINWDRAVWDDPSFRPRDFKIPQGYRRIRADQIIKLLQSL